MEQNQAIVVHIVCDFQPMSGSYGGIKKLWFAVICTCSFLCIVGCTWNKDAHVFFKIPKQGDKYDVAGGFLLGRPATCNLSNTIVQLGLDKQLATMGSKLSILAFLEDSETKAHTNSTKNDKIDSWCLRYLLSGACTKKDGHAFKLN